MEGLVNSFVSTYHHRAIRPSASVSVLEPNVAKHTQREKVEALHIPVGSMDPRKGAD